MYIKPLPVGLTRLGTDERCGGFSALRACHRPRDDGFAKFSRKFFENVGAKFFSKSRSRRRDQFGPKIVKIRAILAIFEPFEVLGCQKSRIFGRPFTPEDGSVWPQTLGKRVSDDPRHFIFRRRKTKFSNNF